MWELFPTPYQNPLQHVPFNNLKFHLECTAPSFSFPRLSLRPQDHTSSLYIHHCYDIHSQRPAVHTKVTNSTSYVSLILSRVTRCRKKWARCHEHEHGKTMSSMTCAFGHSPSSSSSSSARFTREHPTGFPKMIRSYSSRRHMQTSSWTR